MQLPNEIGILMEFEKEEKYWKDYEQFIIEVEKLTQFSPKELISRYKILIEELSNPNEFNFTEWQYEFVDSLWTRQKIQGVIEHKKISENILLKTFLQEVEKLDSELKQYVINSEEKSWWNNVKLKFKQK